jgi:tetratricopeptide (TPR) repeat protein
MAGSPQGALEAIDKAIALNPKANAASTFYYYDRRGDVHWELGNRAAALADWDKSIQLMPLRPYTYKRRGLAHFHLGHFSAALADIAKGLETDSDHPSNLLTAAPPTSF